jgi:glycosyltransferase involved in cell wall biosynthesis
LLIFDKKTFKKLPFPDEFRTWWMKGITNIQYVRKSVENYLAKYISKCDFFEILSNSMFKKVRLFGSYINFKIQTPDSAYFFYRLSKLPKWLRHEIYVNRFSFISEIGDYFRFIPRRRTFLGWVLDVINELDVMKSELKNLAKKNNVLDRVFFTDRVPENELIDFYNIADLIVLLSIFEKNEGEGLPLGLIEASACEVPILAGNEDGSYEAISDKYPNGFRVNPRNIDEIAEKIQFYIDNPDIRKEHGKNGRKFVIENFEYSKFRDKQIQIIEGVLSDCKSK